MQKVKLHIFIEPKIKDGQGTRLLLMEVQAEDDAKAKELGEQLLKPLLKDDVNLSVEVGVWKKS